MPSYIGPGNPAQKEWAAAGLSEPDMAVVRRYRLDRLRAELRKGDYAGALLCDPMNIRYATDVANMQVWCLHNPTRYVFVATDGPVVLFDYKQAVHLSAGFDLVTETRPATAWFYMYAGSLDQERASCKAWAGEIAQLVRAHGGGNRRLAIDKCEQLGITMLAAEGVETVSTQEFCEEARKIKHPEEMKAMRRAVHTCEVGMAQMWHYLKPGVTENQLWAQLHEANIARGGEWIETRLLASGPRTNPWFHESSDRVIEAGDMVAFDTDLIGPYGYCSDISRSWVAPGKKPSNAQIALHSLALEQIAFNTDLLRPGSTIREFTERSFQLPEEYLPGRYGVVMHGVGLCDEYPSVYYREDKAHTIDCTFEPGMVLCVESYVGSIHGGEGVKLENQVLITD
ncbi:MAG TPA: Xaa-Pro peptidase family protein, partial [Thermoanaerobaculia bacterium]|nr:Xaa-Pro peptidase family protein [Thermoanaerobaculia bacterium]